MTIIIVLIVIVISFIIYTIYHDKYVFLKIKLKNIEEKISSTLIKRKELLKEAESKIKENINTDKEIFEDFSDLSSKMSMIELDRRLLVYVSQFHLISEKYEILDNDSDFKKIAFAINETEELLNSYKDYYNLTATKYNKLIKSFPIIILTIIKRRKEKPFFDNKSLDDNDYEEFKY